MTSSSSSSDLPPLASVSVSDWQQVVKTDEFAAINRTSSTFHFDDRFVGVSTNDSSVPSQSQLHRFASQQEANFWALLLIGVPIFTALGNMLVVVSVFSEKALQTSTNYLIVSLAVADFLVAILVMPWGMYVLMFTDWTIPFVFCDIYIGMDVICSTASIFNLVAISIDRYHAVSSPLKYSQEQQSNDHSRIIRAIAFIWIVSSLVGLPILLGFNVSTDPDDSFDCRFYDANFVIVSSVASFYIPCCIILVLYYKIMKAIVAHDKEKFERKRKERRRKRRETLLKREAEAASAAAAGGTFPYLSHEDDDDAWYIRIKRGVMKKRRFKLPKLMRDLDDEDEDDEQGMDGKTSPVPADSEPKGIASLMQNLIRMSTNPLEKGDFGGEAERSSTSPPASSSAAAANTQSMEGPNSEEVIKSGESSDQKPELNNKVEVFTGAEGGPTPVAARYSTASSYSSEPQTSTSSVLGSSSSTSLCKNHAQPQIAVESIEQSCSLEAGQRRPNTLPLQASVGTQTEPSALSRRLMRQKLQQEQQQQQHHQLQAPNARHMSLLPRSPCISSARQFLVKCNGQRNKSSHKVSFLLDPNLDEDQECRKKPPVAQATKPQKITSVERIENGHVRNQRRQSLGTSIKVLRRAATWKIRSQERLQQKRERRERRATKTLGIVLGCFLFCWIPFFTCNILSAISIKTGEDSLMPTMTLFMTTTWLGYFNSALNPIIYTLFNAEFRKVFRKLICCFNIDSIGGSGGIVRTAAESKV